MQIRDTTRIVGLLGHPVSHSLSPAMHNEGFRQLGIDAEYILMPTPPADLPDAVEKLRDPKYLGANVTLPHKSAVLPLLDAISPLSRTMGVVNTITNRDGKLYGTTTDPEGFLNAFKEAGHAFDGKAVAVLGSGGSARTIAFALALMTKARRVALVARDSKKSDALIAEIRAAAPACDIASLTFAAYADARRDYDVVVNATPVGMHPDVEASPLAADLLEPAQIVYDIVYNPEVTALLRDARERGCKTVGGLGMLVHQGLASFRLWTGTDPEPSVALEGIRRQRELQAPRAVLDDSQGPA